MCSQLNCMSKVECVVCNICNTLALTNVIYCDACNTWLHAACLGMPKKSLSNLSKDSSDWFCSNCLKDFLPFYKESHKTIISNTFNSCLVNQVTVIKNCHVCTKPIKCGQNNITCKLGKHKCHLKCVNLTKNNLKNVNLDLWSCRDCNPIPFQDVDNLDLISGTFNSLLDCSCKCSNVKNAFLFKMFKDFPALQLTTTAPHPEENPWEEEETTETLDLDYYQMHDFHQLKNSFGDESKHLSLIHTNIRSYAKNFSSFTNLLASLDYNFDVIGLTETWQSGNSVFNPRLLPGYHPYEYTKGNTQNSGCGIYIKNNLRYFKRDDLCVSFYKESEEFEVLFIEIVLPGTSNYLIAVVYRHPTGTKFCNFLTHMQEMFKKISKENKKLVILGDFNIDLLQFECHEETNSFLELNLSYHLQPHIIQPTRFSENKKLTLIDNIFFNDLESECTSGNLIPHVTDHLPNFLIIKTLNNRSVTKKMARDFSKFDINVFYAELHLKSLDTKVDQFEDVNDMYNFFHTTISDLLDTHAPIKKVSPRKLKQQRKPWVNDGVLDMIKTKNSIYGHYMKTGDRDTLLEYRFLRNKINHAIRRNKFQYHKDYFERHKTNIKMFWKGVGNFLSSNLKYGSFPVMINHNGQQVLDPRKEIFH